MSFPSAGACGAAPASSRKTSHVKPAMLSCQNATAICVNQAMLLEWCGGINFCWLIWPGWPFYRTGQGEDAAGTSAQRPDKRGTAFWKTLFHPVHYQSAWWRTQIATTRASASRLLLSALCECAGKIQQMSTDNHYHSSGCQFWTGGSILPPSSSSSRKASSPSLLHLQFLFLPQAFPNVLLHNYFLS